ncbi:hypothetical protein KKF84_15445 [Myxococcota bacterium]|nr:hypothetical protein [Myxococcota bacterium]
MIVGGLQTLDLLNIPGNATTGYAKGMARGIFKRSKLEEKEEKIKRIEGVITAVEKAWKLYSFFRKSGSVGEQKGGNKLKVKPSTKKKLSTKSLKRPNPKKNQLQNPNQKPNRQLQ